MIINHWFRCCEAYVGLSNKFLANNKIIKFSGMVSCWIGDDDIEKAYWLFNNLRIFKSTDEDLVYSILDFASASSNYVNRDSYPIEIPHPTVGFIVSQSYIPGCGIKEIYELPKWLSDIVEKLNVYKVAKKLVFK